MMVALQKIVEFYHRERHLQNLALATLLQMTIILPQKTKENRLEIVVVVAINKALPASY
jgi:hypothetical protein